MALPLESAPALRVVVRVGLLGLGIVLVAGRARGWPWHWTEGLVVLAPLIVAVPWLRRLAESTLRRLERPSLPEAGSIAVALGMASVLFLCATGVSEGRFFLPAWHDEHMYLLQARMLAAGRLWMPPHPLGEFIESFYVFVEPKYASQSWPGASLFYVPGIWLGMEHWMLPVLAAGACGSLLYLLVLRCIDGVMGVLSVLMLWALPTFREQALMSQAQIPTMLLLLLITHLFLRWDESRRLVWAGLLGFFGGWMAITRPVDALCVAAPVGLAMLWRLRGAKNGRAIATLACLAAAAAPLIAVQLAFNYGITGSLLKAPFSYYNEIFQPQVGMGFAAYDASKQPQTVIPQKLQMYNQWYAEFIKRHSPGNAWQDWLSFRVPVTFHMALPHWLMAALLPVGMLGLHRHWLWLHAVVLLLFLAAYALYTVFLPHYTMLVAPAVIVLALVGLRQLAGFATGKWLWICLVLAMGGLTIAQYPQVNHRRASGGDWPEVLLVHYQLSTARRPAVVLFRYTPAVSFHYEPVYNVDVLWPDDAALVRAHDLGREQNQKVFQYFAQRQPERHFYLYDRPTAQLHYLGTAGELTKGVQPKPAAD